MLTHLNSEHLEEELRNKRNTIFEQERKINDLTVEVSQFQDTLKAKEKLELDIQDLKEELSQLRKVEIVAERYRKKLETQQDFQTRLRILEEENETLLASLEECSQSDNAKGYQDDSERKELLQTIEQLEFTATEKDEQLLSLRHTNKALQTEVEELNTALTKQESSSVSEESNENELRQRIEELELEVEFLQKGSFKDRSRGKVDIKRLIDQYEILGRSNRGRGADFNSAAVQHSSSVFSVPESKFGEPAVPHSPSGASSKPDWKSEASQAQLEVAHLKQELVLMSRAWHSLASRVQQQNMMVMKRQVGAPAGWLNRNRKALTQLEARDD